MNNIDDIHREIFEKKFIEQNSEDEDDLTEGDSNDDQENFEEDKGIRLCSQFDFKEISEKCEKITTDGGIRKQIIRNGDGPIIPPNSNVTINYRAYIENSDIPFDSVYSSHKTLNIDLDTMIFKGLSLAIRTMRVKEVARVLLESQYAYGKLGCYPMVPPNSTCLFVVTLLNFRDIAGAGEYFDRPREERRDCDFNVRLSAANVQKDDANKVFAKKNYNKAKELYEKIMNQIEKYQLVNENDINDWRKPAIESECFKLKNEEEYHQQQMFLLKLYGNLALCNYKLGEYDQTLKYANSVLNIDPRHTKSLFWKSKANFELGNFDLAKKFLLESQKLQSKSSEITSFMEVLDIKLKENYIAENKFCKYMLNDKSTQDKNNVISLKSKEVNSSKFSDINHLLKDEYNQRFYEVLVEFKENKNKMEINFSGDTFTIDEMDDMQMIAEHLKLYVHRQSNSENVYIKVFKG